jgi:hypothetical protein
MTSALAVEPKAGLICHQRLKKRLAEPWGWGRLPVPRQSLRLGDLLRSLLGSSRVTFPHRIRLARGRQTEPHVRKNNVLLCPLAIPVKDAEVGLRGGIALFGRLARLFRRFGVVLPHSLAVVVHAAEA